jgi:hypothetical protein
MVFYISYKGKIYGSAMTKSEAENKLRLLSGSFDGLSIVAVGESGYKDQAN